jgi:predicted transcriptional regulator
MVQDRRTLGVLMSIHPRWARKIISGEKTVEVRRRPPSADGATLLLYATGPVAAVIAHATITTVHQEDADKLWRRLGARTALDEQQFTSYLHGASAPGALELADVRAIEPVLLEFPAPQSWMWLHGESEPHRKLLKRVLESSALRPPGLGGFA